MAEEFGFQAVESFPSLWWNGATQVLTAAYVDDIVCSRPEKAVQDFYTKLRSNVQVDGLSIPGRYLGREHLISEIPGGKGRCLSLEKYCLSVDLHLQAVGNKPLETVSTPYLNDSELNVGEVSGKLGDKSASVLMKMLWLARLSRPDLAHAVTRLASGITRWSVNHDKMLYRLACHTHTTAQYGVQLFCLREFKSHVIAPLHRCRSGGWCMDDQVAYRNLLDNRMAKRNWLPNIMDISPTAMHIEEHYGIRACGFAWRLVC